VSGFSPVTLDLKALLNDIKLKLVDDVSSIRFKRPHPEEELALAIKARQGEL